MSSDNIGSLVLRKNKAKQLGQLIVQLVGLVDHTDLLGAREQQYYSKGVVEANKSEKY